MLLGFLLAVLGVLAALNLTRKAVDRVARWRHWRVGRWGKLLCIWQRVGDECLNCSTDYRYVLARPIRYTGETRETARVIVPLCIVCWDELTPAQRLAAAGEILDRWRQDGVYGAGDGFDKERWDSDRVSVYADVRAVPQ